MITLITGVPGAGKTAALVKILSEMEGERAVYVFGIPELSISHFPLTDPEKWYEIVPDGSLIVIDEVQDIWRPAGPGQKIPQSITRLETHRHHGLDFYILTQGPNLVHSNVRALVGRHIHLRNLGVLGRWWYEWPEVADNCRTAWRNAPIKKRYKLPRKIFNRYKSSSIHTNPEHSVPRSLIIFLVCLVLVAFFGWRFYVSIKSRFSPAPQPTAPVTAPTPNNVPAATPLPVHTKVRDDVIDFLPRHANMPLTAPAYDNIKQIQQLPIITGYIALDGDYKCYHGKWYIREISSEACQDWAINKPFDPYRPPETEITTVALPPPRSAPETVASDF